jgi:hypothetical protein
MAAVTNAMFTEQGNLVLALSADGKEVVRFCYPSAGPLTDSLLFRALRYLRFPAGRKLSEFGSEWAASLVGREIDLAEMDRVLTAGEV